MEVIINDLGSCLARESVGGDGQDLSITPRASKAAAGAGSGVPLDCESAHAAELADSDNGADSGQRGEVAPEAAETRKIQKTGIRFRLVIQKSLLQGIGQIESVFQCNCTYIFFT